jgi:phosphoribosylformimino-5-aminoimidazole carboxamide ribotide isomerase
MEIVPAIDISDGKCVRLFKGQKGTEKIYYEDPLDALDFWINQGSQRIHFVDLDGAWGSDKNKDLLKNMIEKVKTKMKVQIGGGIRTSEDAVELIKLGADRVILGTLAVNQPNIIKELADKIGSKHLIIALDYKAGKISTNGWTKQSNKDPFIFAKEVVKSGAGYILFSCIEADGAFTGPDFKNIKKMINTINIPVYAAGGVRNEDDILKLKNIGVHGVIIGKAFYEKKIPFSIVKNAKYIG